MVQDLHGMKFSMLAGPIDLRTNIPPSGEGSGRVLNNTVLAPFDILVFVSGGYSE
jgi:hypothetical protein